MLFSFFHISIVSILDNAVLLVERLGAQPDFIPVHQAHDGVLKVLSLENGDDARLLTILSIDAHIRFGASWSICLFADGIGLIVDKNFELDDLKKAKEYFKAVIDSLSVGWDTKYQDDCFYLIKEYENFTELHELIKILISRFISLEDNVSSSISYRSETSKYYITLVMSKDIIQEFKAIFSFQASLDVSEFTQDDCEKAINEQAVGVSSEQPLELVILHASLRFSRLQVSSRRVSRVLFKGLNDNKKKTNLEKRILKGLFK